RRRHTRFSRDWSSDVCSSDLIGNPLVALEKQASGSIRINTAVLARVKTGQTEGRAAPVFIRVGEGWLPADAEVQREARRHSESEIGRASCRERVEISVEAVAV